VTSAKTAGSYSSSFSTPTLPFSFSSSSSVSSSSAYGSGGGAAERRTKQLLLGCSCTLFVWVLEFVVDQISKKHEDELSKRWMKSAI
jgi:hypothetical protein